MVNATQDYPIRDVNIYKLKNGNYHVIFYNRDVREEFVGTHEQVLEKLTLRVKRILHIR